MSRDLRDEFSEKELAERTQEGYDRKDRMGSGTRYFVVPDDEDGLPLWKNKPTKEDPHIIDIIPFRAGGNFPQIDPKKPIRKGDAVYVMELFVHQNIGANKKSVVCPAKNYGEPCPICEDIEDRLQNGEVWDDVKKIAAKRRCVYNIWVHDSKKEKKKGVQIWEVSHKYSEKEIQAQAKNPRTGGVIPFAHPSMDIGKSVSFETDDDEYQTIHGHKLIPREEDVPKDILKEAYRLDKYLQILSYKEIEALYSVKKSKKHDDDDDEDDMPRKKHRDDDDEDDRPRKKKYRDDDDDDDKPRKKKRAIDDEDDVPDYSPDDDDDKPRKKKRDDDDEDDRPKRKHRDEDDEDDRPKKKHRDSDDEDDRPRKKKRDYDEDEDDRPKKKHRDDDDDDDRPRKKRRDDDD